MEQLSNYLIYFTYFIMAKPCNTSTKMYVFLLENIDLAF